MSELNELIEDLAHWRTVEDVDSSSSAQNRAIRRLMVLGPDVVPTLVARLQHLLDHRADYLARFAEAQAEWNRWPMLHQMQ